MKSSYLIWSLGETLGVDFAGEVFAAEEKFAIFENCMDAPTSHRCCCTKVVVEGEYLFFTSLDS